MEKCTHSVLLIFSCVKTVLESASDDTAHQYPFFPRSHIPDASTCRRTAVPTTLDRPIQQDTVQPTLKAAPKMTTYFLGPLEAIPKRESSILLATSPPNHARTASIGPPSTTPVTLSLLPVTAATTTTRCGPQIVRAARSPLGGAKSTRRCEYHQRLPPDARTIVVEPPPFSVARAPTSQRQANKKSRTTGAAVCL